MSRERVYLAIVGQEEFGHEETMRDQAHPREGEPREVRRLKRAEGVARRKSILGAGGKETTLT